MLKRLSALIVIEARYTAAINALKPQDLNPVEKQKLAINLPPGVDINMQIAKNVIAYVKKKK
jgi:hypothetical protein